MRKKLELWADDSGRFWTQRWFWNSPAHWDRGTCYDEGALDGLRRKFDVVLNPYVPSTSEIIGLAESAARLPVLILYAHGDGGGSVRPDGGGQVFTGPQLDLLRSHGWRVFVLPV